MVSRHTQKGVILIAVLTALAIIAAIAQILNLQQGMLANSVATKHAMAVANGVAEAGLRDALLQARKAGFYPPTITGTLSGHGTYKAKIFKDPSSPNIIKITSRVDTAGMPQVELQRTYTLSCRSGTTTTIITGYTEAPTNITENYLSSLQKGYLHPRDNTDDRSRSLLWFNFGNTLPSNATIASATLMLDVQQHDSAMEGATLYVNPLLEKWSAKDTEWRYSTGRTRWTSDNTSGGTGVGGYYTLDYEARTVISANTFVYDFNITKMMEAWLKSMSNYGLILRTDGITKGGASDFRLKKNSGAYPSTQWPRIEVKWC